MIIIKLCCDERRIMKSNTEKYMIKQTLPEES